MPTIDHAAAAERDLEQASGETLNSGWATYFMARAQVNATLAVADAIRGQHALPSATDTHTQTSGSAGPGTAGSLTCECSFTVSWPDGTTTEDRATMRHIFDDHKNQVDDQGGDQ